MLAMLGFFLLGVAQDTIATLELIYCTELKIQRTLIATGIRSTLSLVLSYWFIVADDRAWLAIPWIAGDLAGAYLGIKMRRWLG